MVNRKQIIGIALLTGVKAGERGADGYYTKDTINRRVEDRLIAFSEARRKFGQSDPPKAMS